MTSFYIWFEMLYFSQANLSLHNSQEAIKEMPQYKKLSIYMLLSLRQTDVELI